MFYFNPNESQFKVQNYFAQLNFNFLSVTSSNVFSSYPSLFSHILCIISLLYIPLVNMITYYVLLSVWHVRECLFVCHYPVSSIHFFFPTYILIVFFPSLVKLCLSILNELFCLFGIRKNRGMWMERRIQTAVDMG